MFNIQISVDNLNDCVFGFADCTVIEARARRKKLSRKYALDISTRSENSKPLAMNPV